MFKRGIDMDDVISERIQQLVQIMEIYPFLGMLLRMYIVNPEASDEKIFENTLKTYKLEVTRFSKMEIEQAYTKFRSINPLARKDYISLYRILNYGVS